MDLFFIVMISSWEPSIFSIFKYNIKRINSTAIYETASLTSSTVHSKIFPETYSTYHARTQERKKQPSIKASCTSTLRNLRIKCQIMLLILGGLFSLHQGLARKPLLAQSCQQWAPWTLLLTSGFPLITNMHLRTCDPLL